jgi:hypothetical protein
MTQMPPPPGWYRDASGPGERWWDGYQWTGATRLPPPPQAYTVQPRYHQTVTSVPVHTSHTFHLLMTIFTAGAWGIFVWLPMTIINSMRREKHITRSY